MSTSSPEPAAGPGAEFLRVLLETQQDPVVVVNAGGEIVYATESAARFLGRRPAPGARFADLVGRDGRAALARALKAPGGTAGRDAETWRVHGDGTSPSDVEVRARDLRNDPAVQGVVLTLRDVTFQRRREEKLRQQAFRDPVTGLANRALFDEEAPRFLARARRAGHYAGLLMCDLDGFKDVNDTFGHPGGDECLIAVAHLLKNVTRDSDIVARFGGDEFAVLLDGLPGHDAAGVFAGRIVESVCGKLIELAGGEASARVGISVGVAVSDGADTGADGLVARADRALYEAKKAGKRTWREYSIGPAETSTLAFTQPPAVTSPRRKTPGPVPGFRRRAQAVSRGKGPGGPQ